MQIVQKFTVLFIFFIASCTGDKVNPVQCNEVITYDKEVKAIIDINCSYSGCHVQGFAFGDYTNYNSMLPFLNSEFESEVITTRKMPPTYATGKTELEPEEIIILQCWIKDGYLETN